MRGYGFGLTVLLLLVTCAMLPGMAIRKKVVAVGGSSKGLILSIEAQQQLGLTGNDVVVMEFVGDTLLIRRDGAEPPDLEKLLIGFGALGNPVDIPNVEDLKEPTQRLLLVLRAYGPLSAGEAADRLGITRRAAQIGLMKAVERGLAVEVAGATSKYELPD